MSVDDEWIKNQLNFAKIDASASGDTTVVAAQPGKRYRVVQFTIVAAGAVSVKFKSNSTDLTGPLRIAADGNGIDKELSPAGLFRTAAGESLVLNLSASVAVGGILGYRVE